MNIYIYHSSLKEDALYKLATKIIKQGLLQLKKHKKMKLYKMQLGEGDSFRC